MNEQDGMRYPSIDKLVKETNSKYRLIVAAAKRAKDLKYNAEENTKLIEKPCSQKEIGIALEEIVERKIKVVIKEDEE